MRVRVKKDVDGKFDDENECSEEKDFKVVVSCGSSGVFGLAKALTGGFLKEIGVTLDLLESCQTF